VDGYKFEEILRVGELINLIWLQAKRGKETRDNRDELYSILRGWKSDEFIEELARISNVRKECAILSILIPAYETMYRVVLPLLFHCRNRVSFKRFTDPNISTNSLNSITEEGYTYLALIQETLRLHPVVKRIKRVSFGRNIAVDIEAIHLDRMTWFNAERFDPSRWIVGKRGGYMPFGAGKGRCIANERIVGMVVCIVLGIVEGLAKGFGGDQLQQLIQNDRVKQ
jgi:hypothetical protein